MSVVSLRDVGVDRAGPGEQLVCPVRLAGRPKHEAEAVVDDRIFGRLSEGDLQMMYGEGVIGPRLLVDRPA